jgi:hypothetical protein
VLSQSLFKRLTGGWSSGICASAFGARYPSLAIHCHAALRNKTPVRRPRLSVHAGCPRMGKNSFDLEQIEVRRTAKAKPGAPAPCRNPLDPPPAPPRFYDRLPNPLRSEPPLDGVYCMSASTASPSSTHIIIIIIPFCVGRGSNAPRAPRGWDPTPCARSHAAGSQHSFPLSGKQLRRDDPPLHRNTSHRPLPMLRRIAKGCSLHPAHSRLVRHERP